MASFAPERQGQEFFRKHKGELEMRLGVLAPLLIDLECCRVLSRLEREQVQSKSTPQEQNHVLITMLEKKGAVAQDKFYKALKSHDPLLVEDLQHSATSPAVQHGRETDSVDSAFNIEKISETLKAKLKTQVQYIKEGYEITNKEKPLNDIYTKLHIIKGESRDDEEHEICQRDSATRPQTSQSEGIECNEIFKQGHGSRIRMVLTKGNAGIGKSVCVRKFIFDWAEGEANANVRLMLPLPFRELNVLPEGQYSFYTLLLEFFDDLKGLNDPNIYNNMKTIFILDGLDESRFHLDFSKTVADMNKKTTVDVLISSLINGKLLGSALVWITSRPAAASKLIKYANLVTEVQGFSDPQKEEYFQNRIKDSTQAVQIISHIKSSRVLHFMCHIPLFCWIAATVFQHMLSQGSDQEIPKSLSSMYCCFLLIQICLMHEKNHGEKELDRHKMLMSSQDVILKVAHLAFRNLDDGKLIFLEDDLKQCEINPKDAMFSGVCTEILKIQRMYSLNIAYVKQYSFVHLSIQEFLAALYAFHCFLNNNLEPLRPFLAQKKKALPVKMTLDEFLQSAVEKALISKTGHLDLFVRFLHGLSVETNQQHLQGLLPRLECNPDTRANVISNLKNALRKKVSAERFMNLFHCLSEMNDCSFEEEVKKYLDKEKGQDRRLSLAHCSALAYMLNLSDKVQDKFDLKKYNTSDEGRRRLLPAVKCYKKAKLAGCKLTENCCRIVASALQSANSPLLELDLSDNDLQDSGVLNLCVGLESTNSKLEKLRLSCCGITRNGCEKLAAVLPSSLKELDLSCNYPEMEGEGKFSEKQKKQCSISFSDSAEYWLMSGLRKYVINITLDPNTAHRCLHLENQKVIVDSDKTRPDHPEQFQRCQQFLCHEGLTGKAYWEADWKGRTVVGVAYKSISRDGLEESMLGCNEKSWSLECSTFIVKHQQKAEHLQVPKSRSGRLAVFLDFNGGTLSFYSVSVSCGTLSHLHTFKAKFVEPLYPGFEVSESVTIVQVKKTMSEP